MSGARGLAPSAGVSTPETYLGAARAERFTNPVLSPGLHDFRKAPPPPANEFAFRGSWRIGLHSATAEGGSLDLNFGARRVYLVLGSPAEPEPAPGTGTMAIPGLVLPMRTPKRAPICSFLIPASTFPLRSTPGSEARTPARRLSNAQQPSWRAMTICCTSSVPSPMVRILASR